jgi:hypothetical protein
MRNLWQDSCVPVENQTEHLPNTSLEHYFYQPVWSLKAVTDFFYACLITSKQCHAAPEDANKLATSFLHFRSSAIYLFIRHSLL